MFIGTYQYMPISGCRRLRVLLHIQHMFTNIITYCITYSISLSLYIYMCVLYTMTCVFIVTRSTTNTITVCATYTLYDSYLYVCLYDYLHEYMYHTLLMRMPI